MKKHQFVPKANVVFKDRAILKIESINAMLSVHLFIERCNNSRITQAKNPYHVFGLMGKW